MTMTMTMTSSYERSIKVSGSDSDRVLDKPRKGVTATTAGFAATFTSFTFVPSFRVGLCLSLSGSKHGMRTPLFFFTAV